MTTVTARMPVAAGTSPVAGLATEWQRSRGSSKLPLEKAVAIINHKDVSATNSILHSRIPECTPELEATGGILWSASCGPHATTRTGLPATPELRLVAVMSTHQQDGSVLEVEKTKVKPPPLFKVLLLNDDYTPMDFVVVVLQTVFAMSREKATQVMLQVHREGMGVCGTYTREVAAAKVEQVIDIARKHQHPLQCTMEEL
jgi:ATP-dependent Clp protease adaptor protein ClpS